MPNKIYSDVTPGYMVEGAKDSGYLKCDNKGFGDGATSNPVKDYNQSPQSPDSWFEGKKPSVGKG